MDNKSNIYYWAGSYPLEIGSIVLPGNWYRIVSMYPGHESAMRELVFKTTRVKYFHKRPSRLSSNFLCKDEEQLKKFLQENNVTFDKKIIEAMENENENGVLITEVKINSNI